MVDLNNTQAQMHSGEIDIDGVLVQQLLNDQFPHYAQERIEIVRSTGTVNAIFRLGDELCVRLPRIAAWAAGIEREWTWLPVLAPQLPLRIPEPVALGQPSEAFPFPWAIYTWIEGQLYEASHVISEVEAARDLADFILALRAVDPAGAPLAGRKPLTALDAPTRKALAACEHNVEVSRVLAVWEDALASDPFTGKPTWMHADLLPSNLLLRDGQVHAVLDWGSCGVGDPAQDVIPAWAVFGPAGRAAFREALAVEEQTWRRARGVALHQAALIIPYYRETNAAFTAQAVRTVEQVLTDFTGEF